METRATHGHLTANGYSLSFLTITDGILKLDCSMSAMGKLRLISRKVDMEITIRNSEWVVK